MPTYDYKCASNGRIFELFLPASSLIEQVCPECGGRAFRILSPTPGFVRTSSLRANGKNAGGCDRSTPCCGLEQPCNNRPCN